MNTMYEKGYIQEDEIDLRELFKTIWSKRFFIMMITLIVTVFSIIYVFTKTPIYEAKALIEIGSYKTNTNNTNNTNVLLDNATSLTKKLNVMFIDALENTKNRTSMITSIKTVKQANNFIEIKSEAISNKLAILNIKQVVDYIKSKHKKILDDVHFNRELEIKNINMQITNLKTTSLSLLNKRIGVLKNRLKQYKQDILKISQNINKQKNTNPTLVALELMQQRNMNNQKQLIEDRLIELENNKNKLITVTLSNLVEKENRFKSMLKPYNYKNTQIISQIITNNYPIKPKKKLIVIVAFVTGFILSIFLVFFIDFIGKNEDKKTIEHIANQERETSVNRENIKL